MSIDHTKLDDPTLSSYPCRELGCAWYFSDVISRNNHEMRICHGKWASKGGGEPVSFIGATEPVKTLSKSTPDGVLDNNANGFRNRRTWTLGRFGKSSKAKMDPGEHYDRKRATNTTEANLVSSDMLWGNGEKHMPVLDIDVPHYIVPSTSPGHSHLYFDVECSWENYENLLRALEKCGIIDEGYLNASISRKATFVRLPWISKVAVKEIPDEPF